MKSIKIERKPDETFSVRFTDDLEIAGFPTAREAGQFILDFIGKAAENEDMRRIVAAMALEAKKQ